MKKLHKYLNRHILLCPNCNNELNWYSYSNMKHTYFCSECFNFYKGSKKTIETQVTEEVNKINERHRKKGLYDESYSGVPTSIFIKPVWSKFADFLLKTKERFKERM